ncbi:glucoamylase family protein, partial [Sphingobacterium shayense]|uniref:glucoamylase family protein n=1 Tax=Sphingobacterium shayense TaxID=626343 RepID=UPI0031B5F0E7
CTWLAFGVTSTAIADTYPEVIFDNSLVQGVYAKSKVSYIGSSWVENLNNHLLVSDTLFFTPGNALSLQYQSGNGGAWEVDLQYSRQKLNYQVDRGDFLVMKVFIKTEHSKKADLPRIGIKQKDTQTDSLELASFMEDFDYNMWINVKIPISKFKNLVSKEQVRAILLSQNQTSDRTHQIYIDQVEFLPKNVSNVKLSSPAILSSAVAYDNQVKLQWQLPLTPSIRYIKIYRSEDNETFTPVSIRPISMQSCLDYVPRTNKTYFYKIAWVDYNYIESPFSEVKEVTTKILEESELLDLVQAAHINYFVENYDINSGMYLPFRMKERAVVSVKESGNSILSLIVGVEKKTVNRQLALERISRMVYFLSKAQNRFGVFPAYFEGRTGLPDYRGGDAGYDVLATSSMIEALLVARQYFDKDDDLETDLRNRITTLWENIEWDKLVAQGYSDVLVEKVTNIDSINEQITLGGVNESLNAYILAMAAPKHNLPLSAYENGVKYQDTRYASQYNKLDNLASDTLAIVKESFRIAFNIFDSDLIANGVNRADRIPVRQDTAMFGKVLRYGSERRSLIDFYKPFFVIDPKLLKDPDMEWEESVRDYILVRKRKDNEIGVGSTDSDIWGFYQLNDSIGSYRINPAIAPASMFLLENEGHKAVLALYNNYGQNFFSEYGFRAWLDLRNNDVSDEYFATNQAAIVVCIENARSGLIWDLYKEIPEIKALLVKLFPQE